MKNWLAWFLIGFSAIIILCNLDTEPEHGGNVGATIVLLCSLSYIFVTWLNSKLRIKVYVTAGEMFNYGSMRTALYHQLYLRFPNLSYLEVDNRGVWLDNSYWEVHNWAEFNYAYLHNSECVIYLRRVL